MDNPFEGVDLGMGVRKVRMSIKSKGKGKSGGARVITYSLTKYDEDINLTLLTIYDKSERSTISDKEIKELPFINFNEHSGNQQRTGFSLAVRLWKILQKGRGNVIASADLNCYLYKRMSEMKIIFYEILNKRSDIFVAAHILPVLD